MKKFTKIIMIMIIFVMTLAGCTTNNSTPETLTGKKIESIQAAGKIVLGTSADYPPYEFHETINGVDTIVGFDIEIGKQIAKDLGVDLEIKDMSFDGLLAALQSGSVDMVIAGMSSTPERQKSVDFSVPYLHKDNVMLILEENASKFTVAADFKGTKIGAQQGSIQEEAAQKLEGVEVRSLANILNIVTEVKQKTIDGMVVEETTAASLVKQNNGKNDVTTISFPELKSDAAGSAVAVQKGNEDLLAQINQTVEQLLAEDKVTDFYIAAEDLAENGPKDSAELSTFAKYAPMVLKGTVTTIAIAFFSVVFGLLLGLLLSVAKTSNVGILKLLANVYIEIVRGTPMLIQIYIVFYLLPTIGIKLPPFYAGIIAVSLNSAAYVAEIIRAGINAVNIGQTEAAKSLGLGYSAIMRKIVIPQAVKNILPALGNEFVTIIKESSVVSIIGVADLMYAANTIRGNTYEPFKPLILATIIYFILTFTLSKAVGKIEGKLNKNVKNA